MRELKKQDRTKDIFEERLRKKAPDSSKNPTASNENSTFSSKLSNKISKIPTQDFISIMDSAENADFPFAPAQLESDSKQVANGYQSDSKRIASRHQIDSKRIASRHQIDSKQVANGYQTDSKREGRKEKQVAEQVANRVANGKQTDSKWVAKLDFEAISGHEKKLLLLIFKECLRTGSLESPPITLCYIAESLQTTAGTGKSTINRLIKKGFTWRSKSKPGRGGWIKFGISKDLYQDLRIRETDSKQVANGYQMDSKQVAERVAERVASPLGSIGSINILNTKLTNSDTFWKNINLYSAEKYGVHDGTIARVRQLCPELQSDEVSAVADKFGKFMGLQNRMKVENPVAFFISLCQKAALGKEILPEIESEADRVMKSLVEKMKERVQKRQEVEDEALEIAFEEWMSSMTHSSRVEDLPGLKMVKEGTDPYTQTCKAFYRANLWPQKKNHLLTMIKGI